MMKEEQTPEMNKLIKKIKRIYSRIGNLYSMGKLDKALKSIEQEEQLITRRD